MTIFVDFTAKNDALAYSKEVHQNTIREARAGTAGSHIAEGVTVSSAFDAANAADFLEAHSKTNLAAFAAELRKGQNPGAAQVRESKNGYSVVPVTLTLTKEDVVKLFGVDAETVNEMHVKGQDITIDKAKAAELAHSISDNLVARHSAGNEKEMNLPVFVQSKIHSDGKNLHLHAYASLHAVEENDISAAVDTQKNETRNAFVESVEAGIRQFAERQGVSVMSSQTQRQQANALNNKLMQVASSAELEREDVKLTDYLTDKQLIEQAYGAATEQAKQARESLIKAQAQADTLKTALNAIDQFGQLKDKLSKKEDEAHFLNAELDKAHAEIADLQDAVDDAENQIEAQQINAAQLRADLSQVRREKAEAVAFTQDLEKELGDLYVEAGNWQNLAEAQTLELQKNAETIEALTEEKALMNREIGDLIEIKEVLSERNGELQKQVLSLQAQLVEQQKMQAEQIRLMQQQQAEFMQQMREMMQAQAQAQAQEDKKETLSEKVEAVAIDKAKDFAKDQAKDAAKEVVKEATENAAEAVADAIKTDSEDFDAKVSFEKTVTEKQLLKAAEEAGLEYDTDKKAFMLDGEVVAKMSENQKTIMFNAGNANLAADAIAQTQAAGAAALVGGMIAGGFAALINKALKAAGVKVDEKLEEALKNAVRAKKTDQSQ
jgi:hypothetical protein